MIYTENDIDRIPLVDFLDAIGERPVKSNENFALYYAPYRDDMEAMLAVDKKQNRWYDYGTDESGNLRDLANLTACEENRKDIKRYILYFMNENEKVKDLQAMNQRRMEPEVIQLDIRKIPLTEFMKALGQEHPASADGNLRIYNAPYAAKSEPTMVINTETNLWRDTKSGAYGGIYDLAYEMTGSCNMSELNRYIAGEMSAFKKAEVRLEQEQQPKRGMRL